MCLAVTLFLRDLIIYSKPSGRRMGFVMTKNWDEQRHWYQWLFWRQRKDFSSVSLPRVFVFESVYWDLLRILRVVHVFIYLHIYIYHNEIPPRYVCQFAHLWVAKLLCTFCKGGSLCAKSNSARFLVFLNLYILMQWLLKKKLVNRTLKSTYIFLMES